MLISTNRDVCNRPMHAAARMALAAVLISMDRDVCNR